MNDIQFQRFLLLKSKVNNNTRIQCLVKENIANFTKVRSDLMNEEFPSIWIDYKQDQGKKSTLIAGFYRVWTQEGDKTPIQTEQLSPQEDVMNTRARTNGLLLKESKVSNLSQRTFLNDAIHIWNQAPIAIRECASLYCAKKL